jgi:hypothetical protein
VVSRRRLSQVHLRLAQLLHLCRSQRTPGQLWGGNFTGTVPLEQYGKLSHLIYQIGFDRLKDGYAITRTMRD